MLTAPSNLTDWVKFPESNALGEHLGCRQPPVFASLLVSRPPFRGIAGCDLNSGRPNANGVVLGGSYGVL